MEKLNNDAISLFDVVLALKNQEEAQKFFQDLLTESEIKEFANRWKVARMLHENVQYETITEQTGMSSTTIARISKWLTTGTGGYKLMVQRMKSRSSHHNPSQAV